MFDRTKKEFMEELGIEPRAFRIQLRMRSERSTPELHPLSLVMEGAPSCSLWIGCGLVSDIRRAPNVIKPGISPASQSRLVSLGGFYCA